MNEPKCFGGMLGSVYDERGCEDCLHFSECMSLSDGMPEKKPLDPRWVNEAIYNFLGPNLAMMRVKDPKATKELETILHAAVTDLYKKRAYNTTEAWVQAAGERILELFSTYASTRLATLFDRGIPDKSAILKPTKRKGKIIH